MTDRTKLVMIKTIHTIIWGVFVSVIMYVLWSGISGQVTAYSWMAAGAVLLEGLTLAIFNGRCPLTIMARRYTSATGDNFDIYLPNWLARYNKLIFTTIFVIGLAGMLFHL